MLCFNFSYKLPRRFLPRNKNYNLFQTNHYVLQEYIHRVGRTARGLGTSGHALLFLRPEELGFLRYLKQSKVTLNEFEFSWNKVSDIQLQVICFMTIFLVKTLFFSYFFLLLHFQNQDFYAFKKVHNT